VGDPYYQRALSAELQHARCHRRRKGPRGYAGAECEAVILESDAADRVLELARVRKADVIVVGARPLGTVAKRCSAASRERSFSTPIDRYSS